ncbi:hypothetical protein SAMN05660479_02037 [Microbulbifer thermotolerans]|nr:hypothetical protein SAMN05660479_02037 [Microbulbifer thermotolerans]
MHESFVIYGWLFVKYILPIGRFVTEFFNSKTLDLVFCMLLRDC